MDEAWIRWTHQAGLALWAGALLATGVRRARGAEGALDRRLYRFVANPAAFVSLFTLVWLLHAAPQRLRTLPVQVQIAALLLLLGLDHLSERRVRGRLALAVALGAVALAGTMLVAGALAPAGRAG